MKKCAKIISLPLVLVGLTVVFSSTASAVTYTFPVIGGASFSNDYNAIHSGAPHHAIDIIADKHQRIVSAADGVVEYVAYPEPSWGNAVVVRGTDGYCYWYLHINNDNEGTDDGKGGAMKAYAPDIEPGNPIKKGQLIGWVGDSGNAETTVSHLHFGVHKLPSSPARCVNSTEDDIPPINPYNNLKAATHISKPVNYPALPNEILPFTAGYKGKVNVARGDVTNDGKEDVVVGADGTGSSTLIHTYDPVTKQAIASGFKALSSGLRSGVDVAVGDVDGDSQNELITATRGKYHAKVAIYKYDAATKKFTYIRDFVAYTGFNTTPRVTSGDINGDGKDEIVTGTGEGTASEVRIFDDKGNLLKSFHPFTDTFSGGVDVAAGNLERATLADEITVAPLTKGSSRTAVFDANQPGDKVTRIREFYAYGSTYRGGIRLSIGDVNSQNVGNEIAAIPNNGARSSFRAINSSGKTLQVYTILEEWWWGNYDIAASQDGSYDFSLGTGGNRRGSVR